MKHTSVKLDSSPVEFINITPLNPLISKCQIKVCYVGDEPNRNRSVITKAVAKDLANSIPGSPIVGFYNEATEDFEEHNRQINISGGKIEFKETTVPYGFVDLNAKCWFQKFRDDETTEHEYLMTEGYLWTGQYPECQRIIDKGNNQSMELDEKSINATWSKDDNGKPQFFIINEAIMSKLCILGEEYEPCFEGSQITKVQFSLDDDFKQKLFSMMKELKDFLNEGGANVFNRYAVEIGDELWCSLHRYLITTYPGEDQWSSVYGVEGIYEEQGQKFTILRHREDMKYYRLNFSLTESEGFSPADTFIEVTKTYTPTEKPQFAAADVEAFETEYKKQEEDKKKKKDDEGKSSESEDGEKKPFPPKKGEEGEEEDPEDKKKKKKDGKFAAEEEDEEDKKKKKKKEDDEEEKKTKHSLEELQTEFSALKEEKEKLEAQLSELIQFKNAVERDKKEEMINTFYMLSDDDKKDVVENIDKYSLDEIEAKLSIICVRNKVNFNLEEEDKKEIGVTFNLNTTNTDDTATPAWIKAVLKRQE